MPLYHKMGKLPAKRHVVYRKPDGDLYSEELVGTLGFSGVSSLVYHLHPPTMVREYGEPYSVEPQVAVHRNLRLLSFQGFALDPVSDWLQSRKVLFLNHDMSIGIAAPQSSMTDYFFKNADSDELLFIHNGSGKVKTMLGDIAFGYGDYVLIPRGTIYQMEFDTQDNRVLVIESHGPVSTPRRYRNEYGQFLEHSPFCERDFRMPENLQTHDEKGEFKILIKKQGYIYPYIYASHPFDVVGWDGFYYPYAFSIFNFEPITGRIHMPPPVHQNFEGRNFVICSFVPRMYDYHPDAIPAPYHHSNLDSDEVLYYVDGDFMSRNDVKPGQFTLHTGGLPHGPHPGAIDRSIGKKETNELAVMIDPFHPLQITQDALELEDSGYYRSWIKSSEQLVL